MNSPSRINWIDYSKGICIFAVVTLYAAGAARSAFGDPGWMQVWVDFAKPFRMPDFFLISGLFLARVIDRPWSTYLDKKVIHYLYFFGLWTVINAIFVFLSEPRELSLIYFAKVNFWYLTSGPFHMLWFIQMLPAYFLFTRFVRKVPKLAVLVVAVLLQSYPILDTGWTIIDEFWSRYVYFFIGYAYASLFFKTADWIDGHKLQAMAFLITWIVVNAWFVFNGYAELPFVSTALGVLGAEAVITTAVLISRVKWLSMFNYFGKNSIVVYLAFYWPMKAIVSGFLSLNLPSTWNGTFTIVATIGGIAGSFALFEICKRIPVAKYLFVRPALVTIPFWTKAK